jgi:DNA gyrase/topoisomerase IV subunit B
VAGLYAINPLLITEGRVKVASPPLYAIYSGNNQKHKLYVQDKNELTAVRAKILYQPRVKIQVCFAGAQPIAPYEDAEYIRFCQVINSIAEHIYSASIKLNIPPDIIECIMKVTGYLRNVGPTKFAEELQNVLVGCKVEYDSLSDMIVILTSNLEEYSFALGGVLEELSRGLLADYRRCHFHEMGIIIEPVVDKTNVGPKHVTVSQLAGIFKRLDKLTNTKYFKGLGGMDVQQVYATCMDRKTRVCSDITSLGDVDNIFNFMGVDVRLRRAAMQRINS